jgi:hypothetical protein
VAGGKDSPAHASFRIFTFAVFLNKNYMMNSDSSPCISNLSKWLNPEL